MADGKSSVRFPAVLLQGRNAHLPAAGKAVVRPARPQSLGEPAKALMGLRPITPAKARSARFPDEPYRQGAVTELQKHLPYELANLTAEFLPQANPKRPQPIDKCFIDSNFDPYFNPAMGVAGSIDKPGGRHSAVDLSRISEEEYRTYMDGEPRGDFRKRFMDRPRELGIAEPEYVVSRFSLSRPISRVSAWPANIVDSKMTGSTPGQPALARKILVESRAKLAEADMRRACEILASSASILSFRGGLFGRIQKIGCVNLVPLYQFLLNRKHSPAEAYAAVSYIGQRWNLTGAVNRVGLPDRESMRLVMPLQPDSFWKDGKAEVEKQAAT